MEERRINTRLLCAELVEVIWDEAGRPQRRVANLEDISLSGICLHMDKSIACGTQLIVRYGDGELVGTVRYCRSGEFGNLLGVQLEKGSRWSSRHFRPHHLLDPRELLEQSVVRHRAVPN
ncbi:MAG: hypothetical protein JO182_01115 [Acidobacteriaceae bacterium]|nr:hypothetical protein [Acidobacteriaceae bacterium]MBV9033062.1 hypothetical protein [Acidobacteriaceae bacterium]MBV9677093.1 hypothetical protein [Acidobacteriaceae bacterium]